MGNDEDDDEEEGDAAESAPSHPMADVDPEDAVFGTARAAQAAYQAFHHGATGTAHTPGSGPGGAFSGGFGAGAEHRGAGGSGARQRLESGSGAWQGPGSGSGGLGPGRQPQRRRYVSREGGVAGGGSIAGDASDEEVATSHQHQPRSLAPQQGASLVGRAQSGSEAGPRAREGAGAGPELPQAAARAWRRNALMHPANKYYRHEPDFNALAAQYPDLKQYVTVLAGEWGRTGGKT